MLAVFLNVKVRGTSIYRAAFFIPSLVPIVASTVLWFWLLQADWGPVNRAIFLMTGIVLPRWFQDPSWTIPALISLALWGSVGGTRMIIFLAGLQGVSEELYDAAKVDGAGRLARLRHITLPMITPTIFFNLVLGIIGALQVFTVAFVATQGGPSYGSWFYALHLYKQAFDYQRLGYAAALAWIFLVVVLLLTLLNFVFSRKWVYYRGGT
jgi:multiple sugar transport system permease protein